MRRVRRVDLAMGCGGRDVRLVVELREKDVHVFRSLAPKSKLFISKKLSDRSTCTADEILTELSYNDVR